MHSGKICTSVSTLAQWLKRVKYAWYLYTEAREFSIHKLKMLLIGKFLFVVFSTHLNKYFKIDVCEIN